MARRMTSADMYRNFTLVYLCMLVVCFVLSGNYAFRTATEVLTLLGLAWLAVCAINVIVLNRKGE